MDTTIADWRRLLDHFRARHPGTMVDDQPLSTALEIEHCLPSHAIDRQLHLMTLPIGRVSLACHFFSESEIEFDFDP